ncbi:MAG: SDR family oxidoreductase [Pseudomonadales bacterium]|jgi:NAD(P)-dependent dehydrogenase (short-subunit alcohol dehydrogenase family)|nr:SDR family oxidoreductase [Pseudomonadales bacterium]MDP6469501.1 SDR family oxidoreductase [Pseudomonadales bacterium]MDP6827343.1 SDR family oxidoreductase [Pseudomonadales bacterium]MDP6971165.1 SDR family oxidoreductase [Pseudomonadales bacterium]|tara:strand:- start:98 stop:880 length:783 start_codon:yes stop_codon:yes gene_type:complete
MEISLEGRTALITGASLGLGYAMADAYAAAGARVGLLARREQPLIEAREALIAKHGGQVAIYSCDVADAHQLIAAHQHIVDAIGEVDILVNNAGKAAVQPFTTITDEEWQADLDLKLFAAIRLTRAVWPHMVARRSGRVINILNTAAKAPAANTAPTSITRAAGMALTKVLSAEGASHNVLVNALLIGFIKSDQIRRQHEASGHGATLEEFIAEAGKRLPMGRMGEAEECANLALFLASDAASYITGCAINMDGGLSRVV